MRGCLFWCRVGFTWFLIAASSLHSRVLWWENLEDSTLSQITWGGSVSLVYDPPYVQDDPAGFRRQNHGIVSLQLASLPGDSTWIRWPAPLDSASLALLEVYVNLPEAGLSRALWHLKRLDITLLPLDAQRYALEVTDALGTHLFTDDSLVLVPDTVVHPQNWYRIQVLWTDTLDFVYLNGRRLGSGFLPRTPELPDSTTWILPPGPSGRLLLDDYVVSVPDTGVHPNLLFGPEDVPLLFAKTLDPSPGTSGISPATLWDTIVTRAQRYLNTDTLVLLDGQVRYPYPFPWPPPLWSGLLYQAYLPQWVQFEGFVYALTGDTAHARKVRNILWSLSHWPQLEWPFYYHNPTPLYMETDGFHYLLLLTLGYDLVYNALSDLDRMSLENALLVKGIQQADLSLRLGNFSGRPVRSNKALVGATALLLACLAVEDSAYTSGPRTVALSVLQDYFSEPEESFHPVTGDARENSFYSSYALTHVALAAEALERRGDPWLREHMAPFSRYRASIALPGLRVYPPVGDNSAVLNGYMEQTPELLAYLAARNHDPLAQGYLAGITSYTFDYGQGLWGDYLYFGTFLWLDNSQPTASPDELALPRVQRFPVAGLALFRSGWQDPQALLVVLKSRDTGTLHNHLDNNTLYLAVGGRWIVTEEPNGASTRNHNTCLVLMGTDTLQQVWRTDGGHLSEPFQDSLGVLLEGEAQGSYQTLSLFRRRIWILPEDRLVLVWDRITSPAEYAARYQLRYHLAGLVNWHGDTLVLAQDSVQMRIRWLSPATVDQRLELSPEDTVWTLTTLRDSTAFEGAAAFILAGSVFPEPLTPNAGHGYRYRQHRLLEVSVGRRDSLFLPESSGRNAHWILLGLRPNERYTLTYVGDSTAGYDTLITDAYGRTSFVLQTPEDSLEVYVIWQGEPCAPTRPATQSRINTEGPDREWWVYPMHHQVFAHNLRYNTRLWLDPGLDPALPTSGPPRAVYYQRRRGRWNLVLRHLHRSDLVVLNTWPDSLQVRLYPPAVLQAGEDTLWIVHWLAPSDSLAWLLGYRLVGPSLATDTLATAFAAPAPWNTPALARTPDTLWVAWIQPTGLTSRLLVGPWLSGPVDTLASTGTPGDGPSLLADGYHLYLAWENDGDLWYTLREGGPWRTPERVDTALSSPVFLTPQHLLATTRGKRPTVVLYTFNGARFRRDLDLSAPEIGIYGSGQVLQEIHGTYETRILWSVPGAGDCLHDTLLHLRLRTFVHGQITGITRWQDTVYVNGDLVVDSGAVLQILPGTVVSITPDFDYLHTGRSHRAVELVVRGILVARGQHRHPIYFQAEGVPGGWLGLRTEAGGVDTLVNVRLYDAEHGVLALPESEIYLDSVTLANLQGWAVYARGATVELQHSRLFGPWGTVLEACQGLLQGNTLRGSPQALTLRNPSGYLQVQGNRVYTATPIGLLLENTGRRVDLFQNTVYGADIGVLLVNSSPLMDHNQVLLSPVAAVWAVGDATPRLYRNFLHAQEYTVVATDGARPLLGKTSDSHSGYNTLAGDALRVAYAPGVGASAPLMAENNWWDTPTPHPGLFLGPVDYVPYLEAPPETRSPAAQLQVPTVVRHTLQVYLHPMPIRPVPYTIYDVAGRRVLQGTLTPGTSDLRIPVDHLPPGVYFLQLRADGHTRKLPGRFVKL